MGTTAPLQTVSRAFEVIRILDERQGASPSEVAAELDVTRATAHDYLVSLSEAGYATRNDGTYELGYRFLQMGNRKRYRSWLFHASTSAVADLYEETGELVQLGVEENGEWVLLHLENDRHSIGLSPYSGFRTPLHTHACGKVVLAGLTDERRDEILGDGPLAAATDRTITDPETVRRELDEISRAGYAVDWDEQAEGVGFVACPLSIDGETVGSISIACPASRVRREEYREYLLRELRAAADEIRIDRRQMLTQSPPLPTDSFGNI